MNSLRTVVVGLGIQGPKRISAAGRDVVATVDLTKPADFASLEAVPVDSYDAAILCIPDAPKIESIRYLVAKGKHALVEKPLFGSADQIRGLEAEARKAGVFVSAAYNHRFEPHFMAMHDAIASGVLGRIYRARLFYGNGTARLVKASEWRDTGAGVLPDLGSHLLDTILFWFGRQRDDLMPVSFRRFENRSFDHVVLLADGDPQIELEMTLLSWRNHFSAEIFGEQGQASISSLCKWGPSTFNLNRRVLPAGRPPEESRTLVKSDPTWAAEYQDFRSHCLARSQTDLSRDVWIAQELSRLCKTVMGEA